MKSKTSSPPVSNAGPLIHLAKANALHLLKALYQNIIISEEARIETVNRGKQEGAPDAIQIEKAIKKGWIKTKEIQTNKEFLRAAETAGLQKAEATVIQYAYQKQTIALLDEEPARIFAKTLGMTVRGSLGILLEAAKRQVITREKALETLDKLSETMYLSAELYKLTRKNIEKQ